MNKINKLNDYMFAEDKPSIDMELAMCFTICGTAFRMVLPDPIGQTDDAPFELYVLDPQNTFVVYNNRIGKVPVVAFKCVVKEDNTEIYSAYTESYYYEIEGGSVTKIIPHSLGYIPIIEYPLNESRIGAFEPVISMLDAINNIQSNRLDAVEQFVQALMVFENCDINDTEFILLREEGALKIKSTETSPAKVYYLNDQLDQSQTQTLIDDLYQAVLTVVGMPSQSGESNSTSDTGSAVIMRSGWHTAESRAKQTELIFKKSEKKFLKIIFRICRDIGGLDLKLSEIEQKFTRRNYADILTKSQVLTTMLSNPAIHPALAFSHSGMFTDSEAAFAMSQKWKDEQIIKSEPQQSDDPIKKEVVLD
jgi:SPP1 family phage portal protein